MQFNLDNADGDFDYNNASNFFATNGLPAHGRQAKVLVKLGLSSSKLIPVFAGEISTVTTSLQNTKARIQAHDLSAKLNQGEIEDFGLAITRRITDFEGVADDYDPLDPVFYFPKWGLPISRGSVSVTVNGSDGTDTEINIVDTVATTGMLSNENAEIDYNRGLIRFEVAPDDGADTQITATWKRNYGYKRPDTLIRLLLENAGINDKIGITDAGLARFAIEQALIRHPSDAIFSSNGRPFFQKHGIARWQMRDDSGDTPEWWIAHENRLVKYDELLDEYEEVAQVPDDTTIDEAPPGGFGSELEDEGFMLDDNNPNGVAISPDGTIYVVNSRVIERYETDGTQLSNVLDPSALYSGLTYYNNLLYAVRAGLIEVLNPLTGEIVSTISFTAPGNDRGISITDTLIYVTSQPSGDIKSVTALNHDGSAASGGFNLPSGYRPFGIALTPTHIWVACDFGSEDFIVPFTYAGVEVTSLRIDLDFQPAGIYIYNERMYVVGPTQSTIAALHVFSLSDALNYQSFSIYSFGTHDYDDFYALVSNTLSGDTAAGSTFNQVRVMKYDSGADTWTELLNPSTGQPQLAHPVDLLDDIGKYADNRKNFQVIRRSNKTLIFYRRVQTSAAGIAYYNETDDDLTNIYSETFGTNDGLPYSMDFVLDERSDGIYVYTFVVKYTLSGSTLTDATLKVYRERVEPSGSQTEIFSEDFDGTTDTDEYPISVSSIILADDRSKFYFTLDYFSESTTEAGKSELCEIAKDGSGSRTVLKTYNDPLVGPRSPVKRGSDYFYLEGGWARRNSDDDDVPDKFYYPNEGGRLIEIESNGDVTDHGVIWRSAGVLDSPDPDDEDGIYDGWGLHNAVVSNMIADDRANLHFIAGYGSPYRTENNLPTAEIAGTIPDESNFVWLQYGQDFATKIASFPTTDKQTWDLIQQLAQIMNWEIGFSPATSKVEAFQAANSSVSDWQAAASFFFRPRTILPAELRTAIGASGSVSTIRLNDSGLPAEQTEFLDPPSGESYFVVIDKELFSYTGVTPDSQGRQLTGVVRAQNGSTAAAHTASVDVYFVDYFASGERGATLVAIQNRSQDFVNIKNEVRVGYGIATYATKDTTSINENDKSTLTVGTSLRLLATQDQSWAELIGDTYLAELKDLKESLELTLVFSPSLQPGQLIVIYQEDRVQLDFKVFRVLQVRHATHRRWQTTAQVLEIV